MMNKRKLDGAVEEFSAENGFIKPKQLSISLEKSREETGLIVGRLAGWEMTFRWSLNF